MITIVIRSLALGIQWLVIRLLGTIPGPVAMGKLFDLACTRCHHDYEYDGDHDDATGKHFDLMLRMKRMVMVNIVLIFKSLDQTFFSFQLAAKLLWCE